MRILIILSFILLPALVLQAQDTTRRGLRAKKTDTEQTREEVAAPAHTDTLVTPKPHTLDISGYDKPLRSRRETFFASNNCDMQVSAMTFTITYTDRSARQLHKRSEHIDVAIPAGETRQVSFKSWDSQFAFYYIKSPVPERARQATPYEVKISVDTLFFNR
ncbi:MAG: hypothetical protein J6C95_00475 [Muribaculaceae bacterium]|nr:hypothetical protein [Muribaculaceae bacterium]